MKKMLFKKRAKGRMIDGRKYVRYAWDSNKSGAKELARNIRRNRGNKARVLKDSSKGWNVWVA